MKIAVSFSGQTGYTNGRFGVGEKLDINISYNHLKKHVLEKYKDVDIFIHSWNVEDKEKLINVFKPKIIECEKQKTFGINYDNLSLNQKNNENPNSPAYELRYISQAYSMNKSLDMVISYENENNFKYDFIIVLRLDAIFTTDFNVNLLKKDCINLQRKLDFKKKIPIKWIDSLNGYVHSTFIVILTSNILKDSRYKDIYNYHYFKSKEDNIYFHVKPKNTFNMLMVLFGKNKVVESIPDKTIQLVRRYYYDHEIMFINNEKKKNSYQTKKNLKKIWERYNKFYCN
jgi:hypothetical protein